MMEFEPQTLELRVCYAFPNHLGIKRIISDLYVLSRSHGILVNFVVEEIAY